MSETTLWEASPSQWINIWHFSTVIILLIATAVGGAFFPFIWLLFLPLLLWLIWRWLDVRCQKFTLTSQRLRVSVGVLNQQIDEIELYRVKDITMTRSLWMRMIGLSSIHLKTSDRTLPNFTIPAISQGEEFREKLRQQVEIVRDSKRVREMDFANSDADFGDNFDMDDIDING